MRVDATLAEVLAKYGTRVKLVWRSFPLPFHAHAQEAAEAAAEAQAQKGNVGFWAMHDKLFAHQQDHDHDGSGLARAALDTYAHEIGLDVAAFDRALDAHVHRAEVLEDSAAAEAAGVNGAPAFFVGGYFVSGAQPLRTFERLVDTVLASGPAKALEKPRGVGLGAK
jgi:protein-disulfide isomerase